MEMYTRFVPGVHIGSSGNWSFFIIRVTTIRPDDEGGEIAINRHRNIFTFVTNIQDETHRYANDYRKRAMKKKSYAATLTAIPGVGEKTSAALLAHFKTVAAVKAASISDLEEVKGISHAKAEMLYNALRNGI